MSIPVYQPGPPADWRHLDREAAAELWLELGQWVEWLRRRYNVGGQQIRSCWYKHDPMVEELTAAMWAHREVYQQLKKNPYHGGMAAWHNHVLWPMISRLPRWASTRNAVAESAATSRTTPPRSERISRNSSPPTPTSTRSRGRTADRSGPRVGR